MKILFLCTHNACRSILSEVIVRSLAAGRIQTASAGSHPSGRVHPLTLAALHRRGYSTDSLSSNSIDEMVAFKPDVVITVCDSAANETCPLWVDQTVRVHWGLPDPTRASLDNNARDVEFERVIAIIEARTRRLLDERFEDLSDQALAELLARIANENG